MKGTIILHTTLMHVMDFAHNKVFYSDIPFIPTETMQEYYDAKVVKAWENPKRKEILLGDYSQIVIRAKEMMEDEALFVEHSKKITEELFELGKRINLIPNSNILFIKCNIDGEIHLAILKLNYKIQPTNITEEEEGKQIFRITQAQMVPPKGASVEEAIFVNTVTNQVYLIEKRFEIDGKQDFYLNKYYLKGEPLLTDQEKVKLLNQAVNSAIKTVGIEEIDGTVSIKNEVLQTIDREEDLNLMQAAEHIFGTDLDAVDKARDFLMDHGISEDSVVARESMNVEKYSSCKVVLDDEIEIKMNFNDYFTGLKFKTVENANGTYDIIIENVKEIAVK